VGVPFHTPEEYFLHEEPRPFTRDFDPTVYINDIELVERSTSACKFKDNQPRGTLSHHLSSDHAQYRQS